MATPMTMSGFVFGDDRKLRPIWRAILYVLAVVVAIQVLFVAMNAVLGPPPPGPLPFDPLDLSLVEGVNLAAAVLVTGLFTWRERRRIDSYGLPVGPVEAVAGGGGGAAGSNSSSRFCGKLVKMYSLT